MCILPLTCQESPLARLSDDAVRALASILSRLPSAGLAEPNLEWLVDQQQRIAALSPGSSLRRRRFTNLVKGALSCVGRREPRRTLCSHHQQLEPRLIHDIFTLLANECTFRTDRMRAFCNNFTCSPDLCGLIDSISGISGLWMRDETFDTAFGPAFPDHYRLPVVQTRCEACILAVIGANPHLLVCLEANMLARGRRQPPRLARLVDEWTKCYGNQAYAVMTAQLDEYIQELRRIRLQISQHRQHRKATQLAQGETLPGDKPGSRRRRNWHSDLGHICFPWSRKNNLPTATAHHSSHRNGRPSGLKTTENGLPQPQVILTRRRDITEQQQMPTDEPGPDATLPCDDSLRSSPMDSDSDDRHMEHDSPSSESDRTKHEAPVFSPLAANATGTPWAPLGLWKDEKNDAGAPTIRVRCSIYTHANRGSYDSNAAATTTPDNNKSSATPLAIANIPMFPQQYHPRHPGVSQPKNNAALINPPFYPSSSVYSSHCSVSPSVSPTSSPRLHPPPSPQHSYIGARAYWPRPRSRSRSGSLSPWPVIDDVNPASSASDLKSTIPCLGAVPTATSIVTPAAPGSAAAVPRGVLGLDYEQAYDHDAEHENENKNNLYPQPWRVASRDCKYGHGGGLSSKRTGDRGRRR